MVQRTATYPTSTRPSAPGPAADWVTRFVHEERQGEQFRRRDACTAAARADEARKHLAELMGSLREHITRDVDAFDRQLPDRIVTVEDNPPDGGFIVRRGRYPEARLTIEPHPESEAFHVQYVFASETGILAPPMRELLVKGDWVHDRHFAMPDEQLVWHSLEELSEYLLTPVLSGHPSG